MAKTTVQNLGGCARRLTIEVSGGELKENFDRVYADIRKVAKIPGYRPGRAPRDLLETYYGQKAEEEVIKRSLPEFYLKAIKEQNLSPVVAPDIENTQFKNGSFCFSVKIDVNPQVKIKSYKNLKVKKKEIKIGAEEIEKALENLRQSKAKNTEKNKENVLPELNDNFAQDLGFSTLQQLKEEVNKSLKINADRQIMADMQGQILEQLLQRTSIDVPESLVNSQQKQILNQYRMDYILRGGEKQEFEAKLKEWEEKARNEAARRIKLSFILEEIALRENIQVSDEDLEKKIEAIVQSSGRSEEEVKKYLESERLIPGLKAEIRDNNTMEFLLKEAKVS